MSQQLINLNADLALLKDEGFDIEIRDEKYLLVHNVPYINSKKELGLGTLISALKCAGDNAVPMDHTAYFIGDHPCNTDGTVIAKITNSSQRQELLPGLSVDHYFSAKVKPDGYRDHHHKIETYVSIISGPAEHIYPGVAARIYPKIEYSESQSVFKYPETASSRAGIGTINAKLSFDKVGIVGLGGTGSYVLDLIAKTPVREIHLFDGDKFLNHNAFRSPGAPSNGELRAQSSKVDYFCSIYSKMRWGIVPHFTYVDSTTVKLLREMNFVFLCMDKGGDKKAVIELLLEWKIPFVDVGIGVNAVDNSLMGNVRTTLVTPGYRNHIGNRIPFSDGQVNNDYSKNIQIAELNALNATLAVIKFKKLAGFYQDTDYEHNSIYVIAGNILINEDIPES
jgi:hypothetical protein